MLSRHDERTVVWHDDVSRKSLFNKRQGIKSAIVGCFLGWAHYLNHGYSKKKGKIRFF